MPLTPDAKTKLAQTIRSLRGTKEEPYGGLLLKGLREAVESTYLLSIKSVSRSGLKGAEREKRQRLEQWLTEQARADLTGLKPKDKAKAEAESRERHLQDAIQLAGATLLNRLVVIKQLEAQGFIKPMVVTGGWQSKGYDEFREFAPALCKDDTEGYGLLLQLLYDELALELPGLFGKVGLTELFPIPAQTLRTVVDALNEPELKSAWTDDTTLGWVYQYWNDPQREALDAKLNSGGKVAPHEIASKTQMFTERYMVEWLLQNSLGQQWLAICGRNRWEPEALADGTLGHLEARRKDWRARREAGEVALDALMPIETDQEERWKYWVKQPSLASQSRGTSPPAPLHSMERGGKSDLAPIPGYIYQLCRELRSKQTPAEQQLWAVLRNRQVNNLKFRRQHPLGRYIADFYCAEKRLVVELDGLIHQESDQQAYDQIRDQELTARNLTVLRIPNSEIEQNLENVLATIISASTSPPPPLHYMERGAETGQIQNPKTVASSSSPSPRVERGPGGEVSIRDIKIFDPACGSGHFLVIAFDLLVAFYQEEARHRGEDWNDKAIAEAILENNLYGLDLDPRAVQIAAASLYLKAKAICREAQPKTLNLVASNLNLAALPEDDPARQELRQAVEESTGIPATLTDEIVKALAGADIWGSLLRVDDAVDKAIDEFAKSLETSVQLEISSASQARQEEKDSTQSFLATKTNDVRQILLAKLESFLGRCTRSDDLGLRLKGEQLAAGVRFIRMVREDCYDLVVGNPPYQGANKMVDASYLKSVYPRAKADLYAAFLEGGLKLAKPGGLSALLTMRNWMFISQYSAVREYLIENYDLRALGDFDRGAFDEVPNEVLAVVLSIFRKTSPAEKTSVATQPTPFNDTSYDRQRTNRKRAAVLAQVGRLNFKTSRFDVIKAKPLIYWWDKAFLDSYGNTLKLENKSPGKFGANTGNNTRFIRFCWEVAQQKIYIQETLSERQKVKFDKAFSPYILGGKGRKWFEPLLTLIQWLSNGLELKVSVSHRYGDSGVNWKVCNSEFYFSPGIAFTLLGASFSARLHRFRSVIDSKGSSVYPSNLTETLCLLNTSVSKTVLKSLNPTLSFQVCDVNRVPLFPIESADKIFAQLNAAFTAYEAARETSVEFQHPGPSCWTYAQAWAQQAVDRPAGEPLPPWEPTYEPPPATVWVSYAVGLALGRFPLSAGLASGQPPSSSAAMQGPEAPNELAQGDPGLQDAGPLPHGILYLSAYSGDSPDSPDSLSYPACSQLHDAWATHGPTITKNKPLRYWLREKFFKDVHLKQYEQRPIYFPLSSTNKNFVALVSIHRWVDNTLQTLLADYLTVDQRRLQGELADLAEAKTQGDIKAQAKVEDRYTTVQDLLTELEQFIHLVRQCAETGPPAAKPNDPAPEVAARYTMDLDDGVMINSAALWPLLEPQWKKPKTWWSELCTAKGKKDYDWSHLAARYFPERVDQKCQKDPSLAVAHGSFWKYHPAKAYEWELRLQDEIAPDFTIDEADSDQLRQQFETDHPQRIQELREKEDKRRARKYKKQIDDQLTMKV